MKKSSTDLPHVCRRFSSASVSALAGVLFYIQPNAHAASGTWNGTQDALWTNSANWSASPYPAGSETATFGNAGNGNTSINLTGLFSFPNITFTGPSVGTYTLGTSGQTVTLQSGNVVRLDASATTDQIIHADLVLPLSNSGITFRNDNPAQTLTFGKIYGYTTAGATKSVYVQGTGPVTIQGDLDRLASGLNLYHQSSGILTLNGNTLLTQLFLDGTNAVVNIGSGKTMTFFNGGGANLVASQNATLNGPGTIILSTNSTDFTDNAAATGKTLTINAKLTGPAGFEYYHASYYGTMILNGPNDFAGNILFSAPGTLQCSAIGNRGESGNLGAGTNIVFNAVGGRLLYTGAGETTDRILDIRNGGLFEHAGSGPMVFSSPTVSTTSGNKTLVIRNNAAATGEFRGAVQNGSGTVSLSKEGDGTWSLSASNTFSGTLAVNGGEILLSDAHGAVAASACIVSNNATLLLYNTAATNNANRLADAGSVTLAGGTFAFTHDAGDADFRETTGALTIGGGSNTVSITAAAPGHTSTLTFASLSRTAGTVDFVGTGLGESIGNRIVISGQPTGMIGTWATVNGSGIAAYDAVMGVYDASTNGSTSIAARGPSILPDNASLGAEIDTDGTDGPITLAGEWTNRIFYVRQNTATAAAVATRSGETNKTLQTSLLTIRSGGANLTVGSAAGDGTLAPLVSGGALVLQNDETSATLTANADIADNGTASSLVAYGPGAITLMGEIAHTGTTTINDGTLTFGGQDISQNVANVIGGSGGIAKTGTNLLQLCAVNTYTGPTVINQGIVRVMTNNAFGTSDSGTVIADGATLDFGGALGVSTVSLQSEPIAVTGSGTDSQGAIINSSANDQWLATGNVTLGGDTTFGGNGRWDVRDGTFKMNNHTLTKKGSAWFALSQTAVTPGGGNAAIDVQSGTLRVQRSTDFGGNAANTLHLRSGTSINFYDGWTSPAWSLICEDNTSYFVDYSAATPRNYWYGPIVLNGALSLASSGAYVGGFAGPVSGAGSLVKTNDLTFYITCTTNTYSGPTRVSGGWLYVNSLRNVGQPSSLGQPLTVADGTIRLGSGSNAGRLVYYGTGDTTDRIIDMSGTTGWVSLGHEGTGPLVYSNLTVSVAGAKTLYLLGSSTSTATLVSAVVDSSSGNITVEKQNTGTWILPANNTYSGGTTVSGGLLVMNGSNTVAGNVLTGNSAQNGVLKLTPGAGLFCANNVRIGMQDGCGALYLDSGSFSNAQASGENNFSFGCENNSYGYLLMTGGSVSAGRLQTGGYSGGTAIGTSVLRIKGGSLNFPEWVIPGRRRGSKCAITLEGGTFTHTSANEFAFCRNGGDCEVHLVGGTLNNPDGPITYHSLDTEGTGVVDLCSGRLTAKYFYNYGGAAYLMFSGGTLAPSADYSSFLSANITGVYSFGARDSFAGGATIDSNGKTIEISASVRAPTGQGVGSIALASQGYGYIGEPYVMIEGNGAGASAIANLTDDGRGKGTFKIASITITCPGVNYTVAPTVTLRGGGTNIQAAVVGTVALASNASGGFTKIGEGSLTLSGTNTYAGATTISNGTLRFASAFALPTNTNIHVAGGILNLGGYSRTNGVVTVTDGIIANGSLTVSRFTKSGSDSATLSVPLSSDEPITVESGTLHLVSGQAGLYEGPLAGAFNTTETMSTNILIQLATRMANTSAQPPWTSNITYQYTGYLWNRTGTNTTWTFGENIDDSALLKIDGNLLLNNGTWNVPTITNYTPMWSLLFSRPLPRRGKTAGSTT